MANRRMFAMTIVDSDAFLEMPASTQMLYFHLAMRADDDGFVNNPKRIMRMIGSSEDDFKILFAKRFLIGFETGVVVIKHWKIHNYIQSDRYKKTHYIEELSQLETKDNRSYTEKDKTPVIATVTDDCIQNGYNMDTQVRLGKVRLDKVSQDKIYSPAVHDGTHIDNPKDKSELGNPPYKAIIDYLNRVASRNFNHKTEGHRKFIRARWNEGYTLEDFKRVIDNKYRDSQNPYKNGNHRFDPMYLRPKTLFSQENFDSYLNQPVVLSKKEKNKLRIQEMAMKLKAEETEYEILEERDE